MANIRKSLLQFVFSGAYMKRWNDKLRPMEFIEADKQAHKMIVAWILCRLNAAPLSLPARLELEQEVIERAMFDYFLRLVITDIKPPVFYRIRQNPEHYSRLAEWVLGELEPLLGDLGEDFWRRCVSYLRRPALKPGRDLSPPPGQEDLAARILDAAHTYASGWELGILSAMNSFDPELPDIIEDFKNKLDRHRDLAGFPAIIGEEKSALGSFARLCGQLRFQKRWSQVPRIPETSVMGHMFFVACYAYFFSLAVEAGKARRVNNFFCALFHDLPELLTRDIISPVKKSVDDLGVLIRAYEEEELQRRVFEPLRLEGYQELTDRLGYYLGLGVGSEFYECIREDGKVRRVGSFAELQENFNADRHDPKDGELLKACDNLAAFIEAYTATRNGINSGELHDAIWRIRGRLARTVLGRVHVGAILADFD
ncbi:MAG: HD domain-containing protein [Deltaproteobacteria bacterium]|jgi:putative hydrolase of HD superfamily|nr:HD domain-containing protein [Deltaproteobacteria bacterium]